MNDASESRVALVTGAASGIGREMARQLHAEGYAIAAIDRTVEGLQTLESELEERIASATADVTDRAALETTVRSLEAKLGGTDLLIAAAGVGRETSGVHFDAREFKAIVDVNLIGVANSVDAVLPGMVKRKRGHLVALSSLASFHGLPLMGAYSASKAGLSALFDSLRVELEPRGIYCTTACPGWTKTAMTSDLTVKVPHMMDVEYTAKRILAAVRKRTIFLAFPRREAFRVQLLQWLPSRLGDWLVRRYLKKMQRG